MTGKVLPRYVFLVSTLTLVVIGIMLSIFYGQYRRLASGIVSSSVGQHDVSLSANFERQARDELRRIADSLAATDAGDVGTKLLLLRRAIADSADLVGLRYEQTDGINMQSGEAVEDPGAERHIWRPNYLYVTYPVLRDVVEAGTLIGGYSLTALSQELQAFENRLVEQGTQRRRDSLYWIAGATFVTLGLCAIVVWLIVKAQRLRIRQLKIQAEKLSASDFGEPLKVLHGDELGDLAEVFNNMRDKLRRTTISRDYVDSVLSSTACLACC